MVRFFASVLVVTLLVTASGLAATSRPVDIRNAMTRPVITHLIVRRAAGGYQGNTYRIHDVGNPAAGHPGFANPSLYGFNNTGQMVFTMTEPRGSQSIQVCTVYNAGRFIDVPAETASRFCQPESMSDADSKTSAFSVVGFQTWPFSVFDIGFVANVSPQATRFQQFAQYPSFFTGVNNKGAVIGYYSDFADNTKNPYFDPVSTTTTSMNLSLIQASCPAGCFIPMHTTNPLFTGRSPFFHSSFLNNAGLVLGNDALTSQLAVFTLGQPASTRVLNPPLYYPGSEAALNDSNQVAYSAFPSEGLSQNFLRVFIYTIMNQKAVEVYPITYTDCADYSRESFNDNGQVFGFYYTSNPVDGCIETSGYFLYDPAGRTRQFSPVITETTPLVNFRFDAVNDRGQVLFEAYNTATKQTGWGTLDPLPTSARPPHRLPKSFSE